MDHPRFYLGLAQGAGLSVAAFVVLCGLLFMRGPWCWSCRGTGGSAEKDYSWTCPDCQGSGQGRHLSLRLDRTGSFSRLIVTRDGEDLWDGDPQALPALVWLGAGVATLIGLVVGLRGGACPLCAERGTLLLEVEPPGRPPKCRTVECPACEGRGALTWLDRWLAGV